MWVVTQVSINTKRNKRKKVQKRGKLKLPATAPGLGRNLFPEVAGGRGERGGWMEWLFGGRGAGEAGGRG